VALGLGSGKNLCNLDLVTNVRHLDLVALGFVCGKDLFPGFSGKCLFPGFSGKSLLPALGGKIFRSLDSVAKVCFLHLEAKVRHLDLVALTFVGGKNLLPGFGGKRLLPVLGGKSSLPGFGGSCI
jgi:hypothetical protein